MNKNNKGKGGCGSFIILYILFMIIKGWMSGGDDSHTPPPTIPDESEETEITGTVSHSLEWVDTEHPDKIYEGTVTLSSANYYASKRNKESYWPYGEDLYPDIVKLANEPNSWAFFTQAYVWNRDVSNWSFDDARWETPGLKIIGMKEGFSYLKVYLHDKSKLNFLYSLFNDIQKKQELSRYEFADMIVSFVQNIEYNIPAVTDCKTAYESGGVVKDMIDEGYNCDGNIAFGYYAPVEFIGKWIGDCDTRTVFLYTVLKHYGYDVVIFNSDLYMHSILGINLIPEFSTNPSYKEYNHKKYYAWEATSPWPLGLLPPMCNNMRYWNVVLDNNENPSHITPIPESGS